MTWEPIVFSLFGGLMFAGGFFLAYRLRFWEAKVLAVRDAQKEAAAQDDRIEEVYAKMRASRGPANPETPETSPLGPVIPTPDEMEAEQQWQKTIRRMNR